MKKLTCLIIEDEEEFAALLTHYLKQLENIEVLAVISDTVSASMQIERKKPDLIFLDINISGLEGPEFVDLLEHRPKIIIVSGHNEDYMKQYPEVDYVDFIQKPPTAEKLRAAVDKCF